MLKPRFGSRSFLLIVLLSFLSFLPVSAAVTVTNSYVANTPYASGDVDNTGDYGDTVAIIGGGVTSGDTINV
mgnify:FL=1